MYQKYTFNYRRFIKNLFITITIWAILGTVAYNSLINKEVSIFANSSEVENTADDVYFGFKEEEYIGTGEANFLHALNLEDLQTQPETDKENNITTKVEITKEDLQNLNDVNYLKNNFYIVDKRTDLLPDDIKAEQFLATDFTIDKESEGPKILIFHTHSQEKYADSKDVSEGVWGVGEELKKQLEEKYGVEVLHCDGVFDMVNGQSQILGAYERMEPVIRQILKDNPSIEVVIDMHRDGVREDVHLVDEINGKTCAKVMFFNGLCRVYDDGVLGEIESLKNTYLEDNLALSFNLQLVANASYPNFTRRVYLNAYRYSLHMKAKSILIEVGAQTNTYEEALNSMEPLSDILAEVLIGK